MDSTRLTSALKQEGHIDQADFELPVQAAKQGYGHWVAAIGIWFAAWFVILFFSALSSGLLSSVWFCAIAGSLALGAGVIGSRMLFDAPPAAVRSDLATQLSNIASVVGCLLVGMAIERLWDNNDVLPYVIAALLAAVCLLFTSEVFQQYGFALVMVAAICTGLYQYQWAIAAWCLCSLSLVMVATQQRDFVVWQRGGVFNALMWALALGVLILPLALRDKARIFYLQEHASQSDLVWVGLGLIAAALCAVISYRTGLKMLRWLALTAVFIYGFLFYFAIASTLLEKAYALLGTGFALLLIRSAMPFAMNRRLL